MSTTTSNYGLFKYDTTADASSPFNITTALNNNWDKLDSYAVRRSTTTAAVGSATQPVYINSSGVVTAANAYSTLPTGLTAEVSLAENGYIKFSKLVSTALDSPFSIPFLIYSLFKSYIKNIQSSIIGIPIFGNL